MSHHFKSILILAALSGLAAGVAPAAPSTTIPADHYHSAYELFWPGYVASMRGKPVDLIFIGDSITQGWIAGEGKAVWEKYYASRALNFGQGGDTTQNVLWRFQNLDIKDFKPKVAIIMIGTNNFHDTPPDIATGVKAVIDTTKGTFPGVKVILISILPNLRANDIMMAANETIKTYADNKTVFYLDLASKFTPVGDNWKGLLPDHLHLTTEGYEMWTAELNPMIAKLIGGTP
jgi:lysophospholipase L1-like esterase